MGSIPASNPRLADVVPYDPKYLPAQAMLSANENPSNVPEEVRRDVMKRLKELDFNRYPDPLATELRQMIADANGLEKENVLMGNGGDELLFDIALAYGGEGRTFLNLPPTFSVYENNAHITGTDVVNIPRKADWSIDEEAVLERVAQGGIDYIIVASPNNPTGQLAGEDFMVKLLESTDALVMADEAYFEFSRFSLRPYLATYPNLLILRTFSKAFSLAGVRMGYILGAPEVITEFVKVRQPYSVDSVSQAIAACVYSHRERFEHGIEQIIEQRGAVFDALSTMDGITPYPSDANYLLFHVDDVDAAQVWQRLYDKGILVRDFSSLNNCLRVSIGSAAENQSFVQALSEALEG